MKLGGDNMEIIIRGDKIKVTDSMKKYMEEKLEKLEKYLENSTDIRATIVVKVKNHEQIVEVTIPLQSFILRSEEHQDDFYKACDKAIDKLERQIRKNKTKLMNRVQKDHEFSFDLFDALASDEDKIEKRKKINIKPMSEEEAIIQMELLNHQFFVYKDMYTNNTSVLYKRKDGGYGIIESE